MHGDITPGEEIVIVAIDDYSIEQLGPWPWPHTTHARLIEALTAARVIAFDVVFETTEPGDALVEATTRAGKIVYPILAILPERAGPGLIPAQALIEPAAALRSSAAGLGTANVTPDPDGVVRRVPLLIQADDRQLEALSLQALRCYVDPSATAPPKLDSSFLIVHSIAIPVDSWGRMIVRFAGEPGTFPTVPYVDVLLGRVPPEDFQDKVVIVGNVGMTGGGDHYVVPTSRGGEGMAGVEVQANVIHTLLEQGFLRKPSLLSELLVILGLALLSGLILPNVRWLWGALCTLLLCIGFLLCAFIAFDRGLVLDPFYPGASLLLGHLVVVTGCFVTEERRRRRVTELFGRYSSPEVVRDILAQSERAELALGGEQREITVAFMDIRGFTGFAEGVSPQVVVEILNRHLERMTEAIFAHAGTVAKFTGDGLMAMFNAPLPQADHALRAVRAALALLEGARQEGESPLQYGVGIHTGEAVVGNVGSQRRLEYTAVGDTVNLAARLEEWATPGQILISRATYEQIRDVVRVREIGSLHLRGLQEPVTMYELIGLRSPPRPDGLT